MGEKTRESPRSCHASVQVGSSPKQLLVEFGHLVQYLCTATVPFYEASASRFRPFLRLENLARAAVALSSLRGYCGQIDAN